MGTPIKVGDSYCDFSTIRMAAIRNTQNCGYTEASVRARSVGDTRTFSITSDYPSNIALGIHFGDNATIYWDCLNKTTSIYSTEYKPENFKQNKSNPKFTTVYDYGEDDETKEKYYLKAEDKNGNNIIDANEITYFINEEEMFNSQNK